MPESVNQIRRVNYEELLAARNSGRQCPTRLPIGEYCREKVDGKYMGVVDIRQDLSGNIVFTKGLQQECDINSKLNNGHQLHYQPVVSGGEVQRLIVEQGHYQSIASLISDNPAVVAQKNFFNNVLEELAKATAYLHGQGILHVCFSPRTVFVRKGDNHIMLLSHGSFYINMADQRELYGDDSAYVAPEVLNGGTVDERCDVYSIGKFMEALFDQSSIPVEFKRAVSKAASEAPEDRYNTVGEMLNDVRRRHSMISSTITVAVAVVIALLCVFLYFDSIPETQNIEFVKPAPRLSTDDLVEDGFNPDDLGVQAVDSITDEDIEARISQEAKAEEIFRKNYEREADRILSRIYNKEYMSNSEKLFMSQSQSTIKELMEKQQEMGADAGLAPERSQLIASEIIDRITAKKKQQLGGTNSRGIQK